MFPVALLTALVGLAGCGGKIRYPNYYVLNIPAPPANVRPKVQLGSVAVREFSAPRFLKEGSIVYRPAPEQVDFYNYARWAEDPRRAVTQAMASEIQARGLFESVDVYDGHAAPKYLLTGTLDHMEEVDEGSRVSVEVSVSARLSEAGSGEVVWQGASTKTATLDERTVSGIVSAMSHELASAVTALANSMQDQLLAASPITLSASDIK
jgi:ABC-type uncharacterized transport system auxiliary subunit